MQKYSFRYAIRDGSIYIHSGDIEEAKIFLDALRGEYTRPTEILRVSKPKPVRKHPEYDFRTADPVVANYRDAMLNGKSEIDIAALMSQATERYKKLVLHAVGRISVRLPRHVDKEDVIQAGYLGLFDAVRKFGPSRGVKFGTYAMWRIRGAILDGLRTEAHARLMSRSMTRIQRAKTHLETTIGRSAEPEEIQEFMAKDGTTVSLRQIKKALDHHGVLSLYEPLNDGKGSIGSSLKIIDGLADHESATPDYKTEKESSSKAALTLVKSLPEQERVVVTLYFWERMTEKDIGETLNISESRVSQVLTRAKHRLKKSGRLAVLGQL